MNVKGFSLTKEQVNDIRERRKNGESIRDLAKEYNVHFRDISNVVWGYYYFDQSYTLPFNRDEMIELVQKMDRGGISLYKQSFILKKVYGISASINSIRRWSGKVTSRELKKGKGNPLEPQKRKVKDNASI